MSKRQIVIMGAVLVAVGIVFAIISFRQSAQTDKRQQKHDDAPIVDINAPESRNAEENEIRNKRGGKYKSDAPLLKMEDQSAVFEIPPSHSRIEPAFPVEKSNIIIIGTISDSQAFISNDRSTVYSEFKVKVDQILKRDKGLTVTPESIITAERAGGNVRFSSGKIQKRGYSGHNLPKKNRQYVLFLNWDEEGKDYLILTGYEIQGQTINPLDGLENETPRIFSEYSRYRNANLSEFLSKLEEAIANPISEGVKQ